MRTNFLSVATVAVACLFSAVKAQEVRTFIRYRRCLITDQTPLA